MGVACDYMRAYVDDMTNPTPRTGMVQLKPSDETKAYLTERAEYWTQSTPGFARIYPTGVARDLIETGRILDLDGQRDAVGTILEYAGRHDMTPGDAFAYLVRLGHLTAEQEVAS